MARTKHTAQRPHPRRQSGAGVSSPVSPPKRPRGGGSSSRAARSPGGTERRKKPHRWRQGTVALREIRHFQKTWKLLIPAAPFIRTVREISGFYTAGGVCRWTPEALVALQEAAEDYLVHLFEDAVLCSIHAKRVTLMKKDFELARRLGGKGQPW